MDARILQSMLRDNKLDLEQESNMKKLLERGIRKDPDAEDEDDKASKFQKEEPAEDDTYSSQVIKTLADTKFWKAFKRNAAEVLESVAISVTNEIEKGAKVLVGLGFFAWERAAQDVARALPSAASIPKKKVFQLGETSSFVEPTAPEEEEEMTPSQRAKSIRQEFTTPADEISAVTAEISKIFQRADRQIALQSEEDKSKDTRNPFFAAFVEERELQQLKASDDATASPYFASSTLSTTASRGSSRLDAAFQRAQKTKLSREKENVAQKGNRLASAAINSAYQVKTEITSEENIPGYKTKQIRESTVDASKRLAGAAKKSAGFLGGVSSFFLGEGATKEPPKQQQLPPTSTSGKVKADPVEFLDDSMYFAFKREEETPSSPVEDDVLSGGMVMEDTMEEDDISGGIVIEDNKVVEGGGGGGAFGFLSVFKRGKPASPPAENELSGGIVIEDNKVVEGGGGGGAFGFLNPFAKKSQESPSQEAPVSMASEQQEMEVITDAEVVMNNKDNFNFYDADDVTVSGERFTTNGYLDNMETAQGSTADDGLRQVTAEVITDDDFDETVFAQAKAVDQMSVEELLKEQAAEEAEDAEPSFVAKATLRSLDVAFLVVEKGISVAPLALELAQRAAIRATEGKLKDSSGSQVGWEFHNGNVRGDKRY